MRPASTPTVAQGRTPLQGKARPPGTTRPPARPRVRPATPGDDASLRCLLREGAMAGWVRLALEREPSYFDSLDREAERHDTVVLEEPGEDGEPGNGGIVAMGARLVHSARLAGAPVRIGYLGHLRVAPGRRLPRGALREGWGCLLDQRRSEELPFDLTSIARDNLAARRLLERGLPGIPRYHPIAEYEVLAFPTGGRRRATDRGRGRPPDGVRVEEADPGDWARVRGLFHSRTGTAALVLCPRHDDVPSLAEIPDEEGEATVRLAAREGGEVVAGCAVVDPSPWRQYVVQGYGGALRWARPLANLALWARGGARLPAPGGRIRAGFLTGLACRPGREGALRALLAEASRRARERGMDTLLHGEVVGGPWAQPLATGHRVRRYRSILYLVARQDPGEVLERLRRGTLQVESVLL